jgi:hypothetical protein
MSRAIMIFAEFEREFRDIYGEDSGRSEDYHKVKKEIVEIIENYSKPLSGKRAKYAKDLMNYVENRDNSLKDRIIHALKDCEKVMLPFIRTDYASNYITSISEIGERMGIVRNGIAHNRLDLQLGGEHLSDIMVIEKLLYAIRLKKSLICDQDCQKAIADLFGERI